MTMPPASGVLVYFAYGSNMNPGRMLRRGAVDPAGIAGRFPALLPGHRLAFDVWSEARGACVANIYEAQGEFVEGIAYPIPVEAVARLDLAEGHPTWYERRSIRIHPRDGGPPLDALVYVAQADRLAADPAHHRPTQDYLDSLLAATELLSPAWLERLLSQPCHGF